MQLLHVLRCCAANRWGNGSREGLGIHFQLYAAPEYSLQIL